MDEIHDPSELVGIGLFEHAVAKIEDVARATLSRERAAMPSLAPFLPRLAMASSVALRVNRFLFAARASPTIRPSHTSSLILRSRVPTSPEAPVIKTFFMLLSLLIRRMTRDERRYLTPSSSASF